MTSDLRLLVALTLFTWFQLVAASLLRTRGWTPPGLLLAFGNRDDLPEPSALAGRAHRAAMNSLENLVFFSALLFAARGSGVPAEALALPATIFVAARGAHWVLYLLGVRFVRTLAWMVSLVGLFWIAQLALSRG